MVTHNTTILKYTPHLTIVTIVKQVIYINLAIIFRGPACTPHVTRILGFATEAEVLSGLKLNSAIRHHKISYTL
jgi:hypothetical protein